MQKNEVKEFYDNFLKSKMLEYRLYGNLRLEKAIARILPEVKKEDKVLDVGCGIGIVTEQIANTAKKGHVWGIDISKKNIWYANRTIKKKNVDFFAGDIIDDFEIINECITTSLDVITMVDVIEHIPENARPELFRKMRKISANKALLILTYPSPEYQRYLQENNPAELQIIDNVIELHDLINEVREAGYYLRHYSLETVWMQNQYIHCILQTENSLAPVPLKTRSLPIRVINTLKNPLRRKKYINDVFQQG
ncbi:MAG: class I SAM-dependent methyltransferase [Candidatus Latescibacteria bacterium]|nr:class I SAM-dependent methyltransferase [Candidatus Latescibacterota bacterium]